MIMAEYINQPELCKRLIDYVVVVGVRNPTLGLTETPETLRKFPTEDHNDFYFPPDVVFFCQPEGSCTVTKKISLRQATTFVFTLTDKESGKTRYGVCMNFFRPCYASLTKEFKDLKGQTRDENDAKGSKGQTRCMSLTSICIISHHPIFSSFRECLFVLRRMIESRGGHINDRSSSSSQTSQASDCWSLFLCNEDPKLSPLKEDMREIESWIHRLLFAPVPIPGRTEVELELLPQELHPAICFAFPDAKRFSLVDFPIHLPLELLGVETFLKVLTCILLEQKVVFQSRDYNALTMTILAMSSLLYPLEYMFPVIPLLPSCMNNAEQLLLAPTPYIIGVPASFFKYKNNDFNNPHDLWIVDLDSNKITVPFQADELPSLPEPETSILKGNLKRALASLSVPPQTIPNLDGQFSSSNSTTDSFSKVPLGLTSNHIVYGNDVDAVDVAVRVAMTSFFLAQNVLGRLQEHTRTLRLFPRPVVAVQKDAFLQSLPTVSKFVMALVETQNVEYFAEWLVYPTNIVYTRIQMGITDPHLVGDKPRWYNYKLDKLNFKAFDPDSKLCNEEWCEYEAELFNDIYESDDSERLRKSSIEDDDSSSCYSSVSDTVAEMFRGDIDGETPSGSFKPPFTPPDAASPTPNCMANLHNTANYWNCEDREKRQYSLEEDEDFVDDIGYSVSNPPSPVLDNRRESLNSGSSVVSDPVAKSDMTGQTNSDVNGIHKHNNHSSADFTNSSVSTSSSTPSRSRKIDAKLASLQANSLFKPFSKEGNPVSREDQQFLHEVVASVLNANGVGIFKKKRLRDLMMKETSRQTVANKFLLEISDDKKSDVVSDVRVNKSVLRGMLEIIRSVVFGLETSVSNFGLGRVTSAYHFLRIVHTHYYGREIKDVVTENDDGARLSPAESVSNLSDISDTTVSANESGDRSTLVNSDSEQDSGHCDASEVYGTDIDSVMMPMFQRKFEEKTYRHLNLARTNSDVTDVNTIATLEKKMALTRTLSNVETHLEVPAKSGGLLPNGSSRRGSRSPAGSPRLAHMKMTSPSSCVNAGTCLPNVDFLARKSDLSEGFRFCHGELFDVSEGVKPTTNTGRKYLFQGLLAERSSLWDHMEFWEYLFMDVVSAEREALGMDQNHGEMIERYRSLGRLEQKRLEEDEDKVLGTTLFNITAFMILLNVEECEIKKKIRRMIGKAHIGMSQSQRIGQLLAKLDYVRGNDVDLRPDCSRLMTKKTFVVHCGSNIIGDVYFMEVYDDCILLRAPSGAILERWWYEKLVNITYSPKTKMLCLWYRQGQDTQLNKFCTKKCKALYFCIKTAMQRAAERLQGLKSGPQLGGKFPAQDVEDGEVGILEVSLDGITVKFKNKKTHLHLNCIKNCSTQKGILVIDEFVPVTQEEIQHRFKSSSASDICYAVLCLFSYAAASKGLQVRS